MPDCRKMRKKTTGGKPLSHDRGIRPSAPARRRPNSLAFFADAKDREGVPRIA
jgi:hypothetical protein